MEHCEDWSEETYARAEEAVGFSFADRELLKTAFTHSTYASAFGVMSNERLEFLGDAVLELAVTEFLFRSDRADEGALTERRQQFVSRGALAVAEKRLGLMRFLRFTGAESNLGGKTSSDLFEAVVGAIFLSGGYGAAREWLSSHLEEAGPENYRSALQELTQERGETPRYRTEEKGETFVCTVSALGKSATADGQSKKAAQTRAAEKLYHRLTEE